METSESRRPDRGRFDETHWSLILKGAKGGDDGAAAMNHLFCCYQRPLYTFVRHRGFSPAESEDLIQSFFLDLITRNALERVDPRKGKFRSFLLCALKNFLANEWDRKQCLKRGGSFSFVSFDDPEAESVYGQISAVSLSAERLYDRAWAQALIGRARAELREEYGEEGRLEIFETFEGQMHGDEHAIPYAAIAKQLGCAEDTLRMAAFRMRRRFGKLLRREIRKTVAGPDDVDQELRYLFSCL